jgi:UDP-glucose 4-epimerase
MTDTGKTILVTGGTGSLGTALASVLKERGAQVRIFSRDKSKQEKMRLNYPTFNYIQGDITDPHALTNALRGCNYVIHTAAMKDVKGCEENPLEAIKVNVHSTQMLLEACEKAGVGKIVLVSSDKAVLPSGAMGMTKALMEKCAIAYKPHNLAITIVRLGNLLGSAGTVLPIFINLAKQGKVLTVTDPAMSRFLMTPQSSANYIMDALEKSQGNSIVLQKVQSYTLESLARAVIELYHPTAKSDPSSAITITGAAAGEKLYETMATTNELQKGRAMGTGYIEIPFANTMQPKQTPNQLRYNSEYNSQTTGKATVAELQKIIIQYETRQL